MERASGNEFTENEKRILKLPVMFSQKVLSKIVGLNWRLEQHQFSPQVTVYSKPNCAVFIRYVSSVGCSLVRLPLSQMYYLKYIS